MSQMSSYYNQLALVNAGNDKGPSGVEPYSAIPDAFHYLQAQVGPVGPRGAPGTIQSPESQNSLNIIIKLKYEWLKRWIEMDELMDGYIDEWMD